MDDVVRWNIIERCAIWSSGGDPTLQTIRDRLFSPVAWLLAQAGVSANLISVGGLAAGAVGAFFLNRPVLGVIFLGLNLFCDGVDGVVARQTGTASERGERIDIFCDTASLILLALGLLFHGFISPLTTSIYIIVLMIYTLASATKSEFLIGKFRSIGSRVMTSVGVIIILSLSHFLPEPDSLALLSSLLLNTVAIVLLAVLLFDLAATGRRLVVKSR